MSSGPTFLASAPPTAAATDSRPFGGESGAAGEDPADGDESAWREDGPPRSTGSRGGLKGPGPEESGIDPSRAASQVPVVRFVAGVLEEAVRRGAADVHFEPGEERLRVRMRIDGLLRETGGAPAALSRGVLARLKVLADLDLADERRPQDGRLRVRVDAREVDLRLATLPTEAGEVAAVRVLAAAGSARDLRNLGLPVDVMLGLERALVQPYGLILATGPTGSGKTTTLYACLQRLNTPESKVLTVEDPVEGVLEGAVQVPVNPSAGLTFPRALRAFLRHDPDCVLVGEIRDAETALMAVQAALTGHLVLASLHTNDAPSAVTRMVELGVEPFLLAATLQAVVAQRLVRRRCPDCRSAAPANCRVCDGTGYHGRIGLFEIMSVDEPLRALIAGGVPLDALRRAARAAGLVPLSSAAADLCRAGETTAAEVASIL